MAKPVPLPPASFPGLVPPPRQTVPASRAVRAVDSHRRMSPPTSEPPLARGRRRILCPRSPPYAWVVAARETLRSYSVASQGWRMSQANPTVTVGFSAAWERRGNTRPGAGGTLRPPDDAGGKLGAPLAGSPKLDQRGTERRLARGGPGRACCVTTNSIFFDGKYRPVVPIRSALHSAKSDGRCRPGCDRGRRQASASASLECGAGGWLDARRSSEPVLTASAETGAPPDAPPDSGGSRDLATDAPIDRDLRPGRPVPRVRIALPSRPYPSCTQRNTHRSVRSENPCGTPPE